MIGGTSASSVDVTLTPEMLSEGQSSSRLGYITLCVRVSAVTVIVTRRPGAKTYLALPFMEMCAQSVWFLIVIFGYAIVYLFV